jgi:hypothetical protein
MDEINAGLPRVRNVVLAVNLARHSANDWNNPALPDDFDAIGELLRLDRPAVLSRLNIPDEIAAQYLAGNPPAPGEAAGRPATPPAPGGIPPA